LEVDFHSGDTSRGSSAPAATCVLLMLLGTGGCEPSVPPASESASAPWRHDAPSQIDGLQNSDYRIRGLAAFNLGNMGADAGEAVPLLEKLAQSDPHPKVRENAQRAIDKIRAASR
jgi:hypothetical protein